MKSRALIPMIICTVIAVLLASPQAWAGCGCDHPAPCPAAVLPAFGSPGDTILLTGSGFSTKVDGNTVIFGIPPNSKSVRVAAKDPEHIKVQVPGGLPWELFVVGPMPIKVITGLTTTAEYSKDLFTFLARPIVLQESQGHYVFNYYPVAVDSFGVVHIPVDLSKIAKATNFAVYLANTPLQFDASNVIIYNKDGFNLNLFTLNVEGVEKQWGPWYGAMTVGYNNPNSSDILTYWRHDFSAYRAAHSPGGAYYSEVDGLHPDGTVHVDHDNLIIAISGKLRNPSDPTNLEKMRDLKPGKIMAQIHICQLNTDDPSAFEHLTPEQQQILRTENSVKWYLY